MSDHHHDGENPMDNMQTMGIINALKTGDMRLDMLIAMCIPVILRIIFGMVERMDGVFRLDRWLVWMQTTNKLHQRAIIHRSTKNSWGTTNMDADTQNAILIKAIQLFVHHECHLDLKSANLDLTTLQDKSSNNYGGYHYYDYDDDDDDEGGSSRKTLAGMLGKYTIVKKPPRNVWHNVGNYGKPSSPVQLWINEREENVDGNHNSQQRCILTLQFNSPEGSAIDAFINKAYNWYMDELRKLEDNSRYLYEMKDVGSSSGGSNGDEDNSGGSGKIVYSRYKLSDEKTFESLFFRQKQQLLGLVKHFRNKTGKYAIKGYPHKLGLLLHGPPGTGKTSLIKALAQHTNRSIVNVSLSKISTNSELMSVFFDKRYFIQGGGVPVNMGFKDVIFVMEDVDAASKVVKRRDGKTGESLGESAAAMTAGFVLPKPKSLWRMLLESNDGDCRELVEKLIEKSSRLKEDATKPEMLVELSKRMMALPGLGFVGEEGEASKIGQEAVKSAGALMESYSAVDRFIGVHAKSIKSLLDSGAEVSDAFVDRLLGLSTQQTDPPSLPSHVVISDSSGAEEKDNEHSNNGMATADDDLMAMAESMERECHNKSSSSTSGWKMDAVAGPSSFFKPPKDQLNLSGLLNVLDGVVDTPGRILIMTTNHPEMLDPALIRPGRIDKKIMLGYMEGPDVISMLEHYFQTNLTERQRSRVVRAMECGLELTPAQIEQMSAENDDVEVMISWLEQEQKQGVTESIIAPATAQPPTTRAFATLC